MQLRKEAGNPRPEVGCRIAAPEVFAQRLTRELPCNNGVAGPAGDSEAVKDFNGWDSQSGQLSCVGDEAFSVGSEAGRRHAVLEPEELEDTAIRQTQDFGAIAVGGHGLCIGDQCREVGLANGAQLQSAFLLTPVGFAVTDSIVALLDTACKIRSMAFNEGAYLP